LFNLTGRDKPKRVPGLTVSASFLPLLCAQVQLGRTFLPEEEQIGHDKVVVPRSLRQMPLLANTVSLAEPGEHFTIQFLA
jgi:hypothetical protein